MKSPKLTVAVAGLLLMVLSGSAAMFHLRGPQAQKPDASPPASHPLPLSVQEYPQATSASAAAADLLPVSRSDHHPATGASATDAPPAPAATACRAVEREQAMQQGERLLAAWADGERPNQLRQTPPPYVPGEVRRTMRARGLLRQTWPQQPPIITANASSDGADMATPDSPAEQPLSATTVPGAMPTALNDLPAEGPQVVLKFQQSGTNLTITAAAPDDSVQYWRVLLDESKGVIRQFYDLTASGSSWNYASRYSFTAGLFAPWDTDIRNGTWGYTAGEKVNGQTSYSYTLTRSDATVTRATTVTLHVPTPDGTWFNSTTSSYYHQTANLTQRATPAMHLYAATQTQMNALYLGSTQSDLGIDGSAWCEVAVRDNAETAALGLTAGRTFRLTALNFQRTPTATVLSWHDSFQVMNSLAGDISSASQSKPPAGSTVITYIRMDINITGPGVIPNTPPVAAAGEDQTLLDMNADGVEVVRLDGQASSDADGPIVSYVWSEGGSSVGSGPVANVTLPVGVHDITLTVTDANGATSQDDLRVTIQERLPMTFYVDQGHASAADSNPGTADLPWLTISKAAASALPGDTIIVKEGIYRESVRFATSGTAARPITCRAQSGHRVAIAGSRELSGWQVLPQAAARGNPNYADIYYVDLNWQPQRLDEDGQRLGLARTPNDNWWLVESGSDGTHIVNSQLNQSDPNYYLGAMMHFRDMQPVITRERLVTEYNPATHTLTLESSVSYFDTEGEHPPVPGIDRFYLYNKLEFLDRPGEWVLEQTGPSAWRLYVWPLGGGTANDHLYEVTVETGDLVVVSGSWVVLDGLEFRHTAGYGSGLEIGGSDNIVRNCVIHNNEYVGVGMGGQRNTIRNCISTLNGYGITTGGSLDCQVLENEISFNTVDGLVLSYGATGTMVARNYIHDQVQLGHPDGIQFHSGVYDLWFIDNAVINSGQSIMMQNGYGIHLRNNIIAMSRGVMLNTNTASGPCTDLTFHNNTFAFSGLSMFATRDLQNLDFRDNIWMQGHGNTMWGAGDANNYTGNYQLFFQAPGIGDASMLSWNGTRSTLAGFKTASGRDAASLYADPLLRNVPAFWTSVNSSYVTEFTTSRLPLSGYASYFLVGDHIEIDNDNVMRTITAKDGDWITFTPPLAEVPLLGACVANWKTAAEPALDFLPKAGSPALGASSTGGTVGSTIDLVAYRQGDFTGDGLRDIPVWPPVEAVRANVQRYEIVVRHSDPVGLLALTMASDQYVESRSGNVDSLRIVLTAPVDGLTVGAGAFTLTGLTGGDCSGLLGVPQLSAGDTVITLPLLGPLPSGDTYTLAVGTSVLGQDGQPLGGTLSRRFGLLPGDVDGSGRVDAADVVAARLMAGQVADSATARYDVDGSGLVSAIDLLLISRRSGAALP